MTLLEEKGYEVEDVGAYQQNGDDDYVDYASRAVLQMNEGNKTILFCRNGMGMCIVANKFKGVRCGMGFGLEAVRKGRIDDNINALAIPTDYVSFETVKEMVALAKKRPGDLNYGSAGNGSTHHLSGELLNMMAGIKLIHVPYKGTTRALTGPLSG